MTASHPQITQITLEFMQEFEVYQTHQPVSFLVFVAGICF